MSPDVLAKGDKRGDREQNPRPGEPCWRQTGRRSRARRPAGWGGIKHGRHRTQRCHFLEQLKPRLQRVTGPHPSTLELFKLNPAGNRKNPIFFKIQEQASLARINHSDQAWHTVHIVHIPPAYLQLLLCCPLYFSLLSVQINLPPASTKKNRGSGSECGDKCSILYPTRGNLQGCNPSTTTAQQLYCTARPAGS